METREHAEFLRSIAPTLGWRVDRTRVEAAADELDALAARLESAERVSATNAGALAIAQADADKWHAKALDQRHACGVAEARVAALEAAAGALVAKLDAVREPLVAVTTFAMVHGGGYKGPTYAAELEALRALLSAAPAEPEAAQGETCECGHGKASHESRGNMTVCTAGCDCDGGFQPVPAPAASAASEEGGDDA